MNIVWGMLIVIGVTTLAIAAMLLVRRRAPDGGYFTNGDRAAGVFGVLATGFAVLLGFVIFLAFESYDASRSGAETEALTVAQQVETAQLMPTAVRGDLTGELVCYARSVIDGEWDRMEAGTIGDDINPWGVAMFSTIRDLELSSPNDEAAYSKWLDQTSEREQARQDRIHGAVGVVPTQLWIVLFFIAAIIVVFMLFFADSGERAIVQALLIGSVIAAVSSMMLLLRVLDDPFHAGPGGLEPVAMERTLRLVDQAIEVVEQDLVLPCDESGLPV